MMSAALRLESFGQGALAMTAPVLQADVDHAFHQGHERGLAEGREASLEALAAELRHVGSALNHADNDMARLRRETLASIEPVLAAIVETLGQASMRERLMTAIHDELLTLTRHETQARLRIRCGPDLHDDVRDCITRSGVIVALDGSDPALTGAEISVEGGTIRIDPAKPVSDMLSLIAEISIEE